MNGLGQVLDENVKENGVTSARKGALSIDATSTSDATVALATFMGRLPANFQTFGSLYTDGSENYYYFVPGGSTGISVPTSDSVKLLLQQ